MTRIALIGLEDGDERLGKILAQLTERHPDYEVVHIVDPEQLRAQQTEYSVVVIDEAKFHDRAWDDLFVRETFKDQINIHHESYDQLVNVGTIGHIDHGSRLSRNSVHGAISPARTLKALDRRSKARDWYDRERVGKGQRKANKADRWNGNGRPGSW